MGLHMAANFSRWLEAEGFPKLIVWNRTASKADKFASENAAVVAQSLEEVAEKCDVVIASLGALSVAGRSADGLSQRHGGGRGLHQAVRCEEGLVQTQRVHRDLDAVS